MNKRDIIREYNLFLKHFPLVKPEEFVLGAGGACVMHGIRTDTEDMDMGLIIPLYDKLRDSGKYETHIFKETVVVSYNKYIDLHPLETGETKTIDGVCCYSAERLLAQKLTLNRPKDQNDIIALRKLVKGKQNA